MSSIDLISRTLDQVRFAPPAVIRPSVVMEEAGYWPTFALHSPAAGNTANAPISHQDCSV